MTDTDTSKQFRRWPCLNGHSREMRAEFDAAAAAHFRAKNAHPAAHKMKRYTSGCNYDSWECSCGFGYSADSSG